MKQPSRELIARLLYVSEEGSQDQRNSANARLASLRDAYRNDRRFPSTKPVVGAMEAEIWTWWHEVLNEAQTALPRR